MALVPARMESSFLELEMDGSVESLGRLLDAQKKIFHSQIDQLQRLFVNQCKLTGVNPLSQEMAAGALSIKIGKKPRDLLNPKAVKYMQSIFAIKDTIGKKETREISALCGVTVTQVREFFSGQRSKVRKLVTLVREKAVKSDASDAANEGCSDNPEATLLSHIDTLLSAVDVKNVGDSAEVAASNGNLPAIQYYQNVPVSSIDSKPIQVVVPSSSSQEESIPGIYEDDKKFLENIFNLMRKEGTFSGQVKLMEWILQIHNSAVLVWFLTKGGITILATWLSQAAIEEQTTLLNVIIKVLCHLPLHKALPAQMSSILQTVNKLRFYRTPDISNRAKVLLSRWSKMLVRNQAVKYPSILNSSNGVQKDIIRKQRISEILSEEFWRSKIGITDEILALTESSGNDSKSDPKQALKLLTASCNRSSRKQGQSALSIKIKERRKVRLVEQLDQKAAGRIAQVGRAPPSNLSRPISADDIQKAKMREMFMQHKYGKADASSNDNKKIEDSKDLPAPQSKKILPPPRIMQLEQINIEEKKLADVLRGDSEAPIDSICTGALEEESLERLKSSQFQWQTPLEMKIDSSWRVGEAESSKELDVQAQRIKREKETFYSSKFDIPPDPKEPWDVEMDFDDSLTPEIPIDQPLDADAVEDPLDHSVDEQTIPDDMPAAMEALPPVTSYAIAAEPDLELLAVLLKNPELVFALTSGQGKNLSSDERVALLDMIKHSSVALGAAVTGISSSTSQEKPKDPVPISLPSPTPPSDVERAAGWRSAFHTVSKAQLPQSQFPGAVRHSVPTLTPTPHPTVMVLPAQVELQSAIVPTSHVLISANTAPQAVALTSLTSQRPCPAVSQHILPSGYAEPLSLNTECSLLSKRYAVSSSLASAAPSPTPAAFRQDTYCRKSLSTSTISSLPSLPPPQKRSQSLMISDPSVAAIPPNPTSLSRCDASTEWCEWRDMMPEWRDKMPESSTRRQNAEEFTVQGSPRFNASIRGIYPTQQGRSTGRVEIVGRSRDSETWSPERIPLRSSESRHGHSRSHAESRREQGWNQRHEWSRQRSSGHHDQYRLSNGSGGRWRERDRDRRR